MRIVVVHASDATDPPIDPVLDQVEAALSAGRHQSSRLAVDKNLTETIRALSDHKPDLVFNLAESYSGSSALEASVAGLLNLLHLRYTGSSPSGLMLAGDKSISTKILRANGIKTPTRRRSFVERWNRWIG
jgi:D-alanine-D-alanine ligase and related ATP-grasp enzymes